MDDKEDIEKDAILTTEGLAEEVPEGDEKSMLWEENHKKIINAISIALFQSRLSPPGIAEISRITGLSRPTIYAHLREYSTQPAYRESKRMFEMMKFDVLMRLCSRALSGDVKAIRMYLQITGSLENDSLKK